MLISLREAYVPTKQRDLKVNKKNVLHESRPASRPCSAARLSAPPALTTSMPTATGVHTAYHPREQQGSES